MLRRKVTKGDRQGKNLWRCQELTCRGLINIEDGDAELPPPVAGESAQARFERDRAAQAERLRYAVPVLAAVGVLSAAAVFFAATPILGMPFAAGTSVVVVAAAMFWITRSPRTSSAGSGEPKRSGGWAPGWMSSNAPAS